MSNAVELVNIESKAEQEMSAVMAKATAFVVQDEQTYVDADQIITEVRGKVKALEPELLPMKETATRAWKAAVALWKKYIDDPLEACKTLDRKRYAWKKSEDDRHAQEAEVLRREAEKEAADEKLALATRMEKAGMVEQAIKVLDAPSAPVDIPEPTKVQVSQGQTMMELWQGRVVNPDLVPRELCSPDPVKINKKAKMLKGKASDPGIVYEDVGSSRRKG